MEAKVDNTLKTYAKQSEAKKIWNLKNKHTFYFNNHSQIFSLCLNFSLCHRKIFSLCLKIFPCVKVKFPVFSLSGKSKNQILCFPCAVATLEFLPSISILLVLYEITHKLSLWMGHVRNSKNYYSAIASSSTTKSITKKMYIHLR